MGTRADNRSDIDRSTNWPAMLRLAVIAGVFAALAAVALNGLVAETTIVVCVIVAATMASWFQIEHPRPHPHHARVRRD